MLHLLVSCLYSRDQCSFDVVVQWVVGKFNVDLNYQEINFVLFKLCASMFETIVGVVKFRVFA